MSDVCKHASLHGVELENSHSYDSRRVNVIGPDVWECDNCLTIQVEDSVGVLDADGRDMRADLTEAVRLLRRMNGHFLMLATGNHPTAGYSEDFNTAQAFLARFEAVSR